MKTFGCTYLGATVLSLILTPIVAWIARAMRFVDRPGTRKLHATAIPRIGGVAVIAAMLALTIAVMTLDNAVGKAFRADQSRIVTMLAGGVFVALVGLIDDIHGLRARVKFFAQIAAATAVCVVGVRIESLAVGGLFTLEFRWLAWPITIFWIVGITNAVNLIDGLDGLAAGISAVACGVIAAFALHSGQPVMAALMLALLGSLTGFLFFNFNPARIFMGDSGTYFLGFVLATSSVMCAMKASTVVGLALPALALGVPIFDTLFSILRRFLERRSLFAPDRSHVHHLLMDMGLRQRHVAIFLYVVTLAAAGLGMFMMITHDVGTLVVFGCTLVLIMLAFRIVGSVRLRQTLAALRRKRATLRNLSEHKRSLEEMQLRFREVSTFDQWWQVLCDAAGEMDIVRLSLAVTNRDGTSRTLTWRRPGSELAPHEIIKTTVPVRDRRSGPPLEVTLDTAVNGSLESAGRRVSFFGRLIDEYSIATLPTESANRAATASAAWNQPVSDAPAHRPPAGEGAPPRQPFGQ